MDQNLFLNDMTQSATEELKRKKENSKEFFSKLSSSVKFVTLHLGLVALCVAIGQLHRFEAQFGFNVNTSVFLTMTWSC